MRIVNTIVNEKLGELSCFATDDDNPLYWGRYENIKIFGEQSQKVMVSFNLYCFNRNFETNIFSKEKGERAIQSLTQVYEKFRYKIDKDINDIKENFYCLYQEYIEEGEIKSSILQNKNSFFDKIYVNEIRIFLNGFAIVFITDDIKQKICFQYKNILEGIEWMSINDECETDPVEMKY